MNSLGACKRDVVGQMGYIKQLKQRRSKKIEQESRHLHVYTFQNYFRFMKAWRDDRNCRNVKEEFYKVYGPCSYPVPNIIRSIMTITITFSRAKRKWWKLTKKIKELKKRATSPYRNHFYEKNEVLSKYLEREGITHAVLNAKNHEKEGEIIAEAGKNAAGLLLANMAGRGVDIKLGGPGN